MIFSRFEPGDDTFSDRLRAQFDRKAEKLRKHRGSGLTTVLLVESDDIALMNVSKLVTGIRRAYATGPLAGVDQMWYADNFAVILEELIVMRADELVDAIVEHVVLTKPVHAAKPLASRVDSPSFHFECLVFVWWIVDLLLFQELDAERCKTLTVALTGRLLEKLENRGFRPEERSQLDDVRKIRFLEYGGFAHRGATEEAQALSFAAWRHILAEAPRDIAGPFVLVGVASQTMDSLRPLIRKLRTV